MTQQEAAITKIEPSVVELDVTTAQGQQIGSGVIIDANGDIITNNHVVNGEQSILKLFCTTVKRSRRNLSERLLPMTWPLCVSRPSPI